MISLIIVRVYHRKLELSRLTLLTDWNGTIETVKGKYYSRTRNSDFFNFRTDTDVYVHDVRSYQLFQARWRRAIARYFTLVTVTKKDTRRGIVKRSLDETTACGKSIPGSSGEYLVCMTSTRYYLSFCARRKQFAFLPCIDTILCLQVCDPEGHTIVLSRGQCEGGLLGPTRLLSVNIGFDLFGHPGLIPWVSCSVWSQVHRRNAWTRARVLQGQISGATSTFPPAIVAHPQVRLARQPPARANGRWRDRLVSQRHAQVRALEDSDGHPSAPARSHELAAHMNT